MKSKFPYFLTGLVVLLLSGCSLPFGSSKTKTAINITSTPSARVLINGEYTAMTPFYNESMKEGEYTIRLEPENNAYLPWEGRVELVSGYTTILSRELGETTETSSGYMISLDSKLDPLVGGIMVTALPEGAMVSINNEPYGNAPLALENLAGGEYVITVSSPGYIQKSFEAQLLERKRVNISVSLAKKSEIIINNLPLDSSISASLEPENGDKADPDKNLSQVLDDEIETEQTQSAESIGADLKPPFVTVEQTPTGWLNVRKTPSTSAAIIQKINPGDSYAFLEENTTGWYKIELDEELEGWVSSKYVKLTK
jgi:hypothetical protein